jgi:hypothetical protein
MTVPRSGRRFAAAARAAAGLLVLAASAATAAAAGSPELRAIVPPGGPRGAECTVELRGARLQSPQEILFYRPGLEVAKLETLGDKGGAVKATLRIAPDCALGEHPLRLRTSGGLTELRIFRVGPFPSIDEAEPNHDLGAAQSVAMNVTVHGTVQSEDVDCYAVEARAGQRISAEVEGMRLGCVLFDPHLSILDTNRFELAASDDTPLFRQDGAVSVLAPADGRYVVQIREASYGGGDDARYRLHIGSFARPLAVYPAGGPAGADVALRFIGDVSGKLTVTQRLEAGQTGAYPSTGPDMPPSPNPIRVSSFANVLEVEPNDESTAGTPWTNPIPVAFNGVIARDGDVDWFTFEAKKDQSLEIEVFARRLGSPLDSMVRVKGPDGKEVGNNDDSQRMDSSVQLRAPADGAHRVMVRDHLRNGGPAYTYRLEVTASQPSLRTGIPVFRRESQDRQTVVVPRGNRYATLVAVRRENLGGEMVLEPSGLPPGVTVTAATAGDGIDEAPVLFEAAADAPLAGALAGLAVRPADPGRKVTGGFRQTVELVYGDPNNTVYYGTEVDRLAVAVAEEVPFHLEIEPPRVPLVQAGTLPLTVIAKRREGFDEAVRVRLLYQPPGVNAAPEVTIPKGQDRAQIVLNAEGGARTRTWKTAVIGAAKVGGGDVWVATPFIDLEVAAPYLGGKLSMAVVEQGRAADVVCELTHLRPFEGKARLELVGLPARCAAAPAEITRDDKTATFRVTTEEKSPAGQHKNLFCSVRIPQNGGLIVQSLAPGGVLRIDAPRKSPTAAPPPAPAKSEAPKPAAAPPSRLEQLRMEQVKKATAGGGG